ncbi:phosphoinositide phosphatase SAC2-like isoform X2 [Juglans regia]|uniref:Phosphoinositide phosphatase SAC2-like isoform X2 n=1 Tax=Juglans regia TaxID=51240 RepID=A0A6P9DVJ3_JUGRE|nr:phosphoinositide phosphatase SAC2-like isoform X2 [Juglans regia]
MGSEPIASTTANYYLQSFRLYETFSYYIIGRDKKRAFWKVLKIDRLECSELDIDEDSATYSENECSDLLKRLDEGNKITGGLKLVTTCYGIIGFVKFLEPYYMLLITKRKKIGEISGHKIYAITKREMIPIPNPTVRTLMAHSKNENRYKKLLCTMDLTKDFFFSYSYHVMRSLQKNLYDYKTGQHLYKKMCVWNEFLTSEIRNRLGNTLWTVALVHGFFKQVKLSVPGRDFKLTLIARRSRCFAGTRYLKRGVNDKGRVANDVETEQIVSEDPAEGCPTQMSSVVQYRGSVPLFWSQNALGFRKFRPVFSLRAEQHNYEAMGLHFRNLVKRYGKPIVILSLLKTRGKKRAEKTLGATYAKAIASIIDNLPEMNHLRFCRWDLHTHMYYRRPIYELQQLGDLAADTLDSTGIFYCQVPPKLWQDGFLNLSYFDKYNGHNSLEDLFNKNGDAGNLEANFTDGGGGCDANENYGVKCMSQKGVLRSNCMDCLDRTNVVQYAYGLAALGRQLHALGFIESPYIDLEDPLAENLMTVYEAMGDTLALQYGGSPAHNKIFADIRGQWRPAIDYQDLITTVKRYCSNAFLDFVRQDAMNLFLGYFRPQQGKQVLWELDSDQRYNVGRSSFKRSLSDSDIRSMSNSPMVSTDVTLNPPFSGKVRGSSMNLLGFLADIQNQPLHDQAQGGSTSILAFMPEISTGTRLSPGCMQEDQSLKSDNIYDEETRDASAHSSLFDMDWHSSAGNSFYEANERCFSCETIIHRMKGVLRGGYSESFVKWVFHGEALFLRS